MTHVGVPQARIGPASVADLPLFCTQVARKLAAGKVVNGLSAIALQTDLDCQLVDLVSQLAQMKGVGEKYAWPISQDPLGVVGMQRGPFVFAQKSVVMKDMTGGIGYHCSIQELAKLYLEVVRSALSGWKILGAKGGKAIFVKMSPHKEEGQLVSALFRKFLPKVFHDFSSRPWAQSFEGGIASYELKLTIEKKDFKLIRNIVQLFRNLSADLFTA